MSFEETMIHPRRMSYLVMIVCAVILSTPAHAARRKSKAPAAPLFTTAAANDATRTPKISSSAARGSSVLRLEVLLDRDHFSPGEIDGHYGSNTSMAVAAFNEAHKIEGGAAVTAATWKALDTDTAPVIVPYTLTANDLSGAFVPIPAETADKAMMATLGYATVIEGLGEKFHISPSLLKTLNPTVTMDHVGAIIEVPNVARPPIAKTTSMTIRVTKSRSTVEIIDHEGAILARYPATIGSVHDPLPIGKWKINGVAWNPSFSYNPDLFWDAKAGDKKAKLASGPNNPVGPVWIDLSKPHYGIHGTPEPSKIGKTTSHGCIRLTNWDAIELAKVVTPGMAAVLQE
jgi:lipoprotein-anchoring transpeptidase ErfK/SrfK